MQSKALRFGAFGALFIGTFVIGLLLTLPTGLMSRVVETQLEQALDWKYDVAIESVRINGLIGVRLNTVSLMSTAPVAEGERPMPATTLDRIQLRVGPLSLLSGRPRLRLRVDVGEGRMVVHYRPKDGFDTRLRVELHEIDLRRLSLLRRYVGGLPIQGELNGSIELGTEDRLEPADFATRLATGDLDVGDIELGISGMFIGPGSLRGPALEPLGGFLPLPSANLGNFVARITIGEGQVMINQLECAGEDLEFGVDEGRIELRQPFGTSRVQAQFSFSPAEAFIEEAELGPAFARVPFLASASTGDGYALAISGTLARPGNPQPLGGPRGRR